MFKLKKNTKTHICNTSELANDNIAHFKKQINA